MSAFSWNKLWMSCNRVLRKGQLSLSYATDLGCDAIIVSASWFQAISLPEMNSPHAPPLFYQSLARYRAIRRFNKYERDIENDLENEQVEPGAKAEVEHMSRLWPSCVQPIIKKLKEDQALDFHEPPRVWWIGTGVAGSLPFHAAGQYINDFKKFQDSENTLSQIIPSYTSTIKAFSYARLCASRAVKLNSSETSILVKMPTTPGIGHSLEWTTRSLLSSRLLKICAESKHWSLQRQRRY